MNKAGGIIAIIAGVVGMFAAGATIMGGLWADGSTVEGAPVLAMGCGGVLCSFLVIYFGAAAIGAATKTPGVLLILSSIAGAIVGGIIVGETSMAFVANHHPWVELLVDFVYVVPVGGGGYLLAFVMFPALIGGILATVGRQDANGCVSASACPPGADERRTPSEVASSGLLHGDTCDVDHAGEAHER